MVIDENHARLCGQLARLGTLVFLQETYLKMVCPKELLDRLPLREKHLQTVREVTAETKELLEEFLPSLLEHCTKK